MKIQSLPQIGESITTSKSGVVGIVLEVVLNKKGDTARVRLDVEGMERWTTVPVL